MKIRLDHIAKIEGHAGFFGHILKGDVTQAKIETQEGARLIEGILRGRPFYEAPIITARICGICPVVHALTAIEALEDALKIKVTPQVILLRKLLQYAQVIHSHTLHLFFLSFPDFVSESKIHDLVGHFPKEAKAALKIRNFALRLIRKIGGRVVHPITTAVGGFKKWPTKRELGGLLENFDEVMKASYVLVNLLKSLKYPKFSRQTLYISLLAPQEYAIYRGEIFTSGGLKFKPQDFVQEVQEKQKSYSPLSKRGSFQGQSYMVGALARLNNNFNKLNPEAKKLWPAQLKTPLHNTFYNILAQGFEVVHLLYESEMIIKSLLKGPIKQKNVEVKIRAGLGLAAMEAPRGLLFHSYELDQRGFIKNCNIITPTAQFLNNLEDDLRIFLPEAKKMSPQKQRAKIKALVRAYDPCITCATH